MASSRPERDNRDEFLLFPAIRDGLWNEFSSAFAKKSDLQFAVHRAGPMVQAFSEKDCHKGIGSRCHHLDSSCFTRCAPDVSRL